jgi:hypothetical protein
VAAGECRAHISGRADAGREVLVSHASEASDDGQGPGRAARAVIVAFVVLPIVVAVIRALAHHWFPIGDAALFLIRSRDVFTGHHPLLGAWTSASLSIGVDVNNPGPIYEDLIAPFAHVFSAGSGAAVGVGAVNIGAVLGVSAASRHIGGWSMQRWFLLAAAALSWTMGSELLIDIWQAHALLLTFLVYLVLLIGLSRGRPRCVPWALAVGSLLVQTHISYAYILAAFTPVALVLAWYEHRPLTRARLIAGLRSRTSAVSAAVVVVLWSQPIIEQLFGEGKGNLARLAANSGGGDFTIGMRNATKIAAAVIALPPWWLREGFSTTVPSTRITDGPGGPRLVIESLPGGMIAVAAVLALVGLLAFLAVACRRAAAVTQSNACVLAACGTVLAVVCLGVLTVGKVGLATHHVRWIWAFSVFVHVVVVWSIATLAVHHLARPVLRRAVTPAVLAVITVLTALNLPYFAQQEGPVAAYGSMTALREIFRQLEPLRAGAPVVYDTTNLRVFEPYSSAVMMRLQELGIEFRVADAAMVRQLGNGRRASGHETTSIFQLEGSDALLYSGPGCRFAIADGVPDDVAATASAAAELLAAALVDGSILVDPSTLPVDEQSRLEAAGRGDLVVARRLVYEGYVQRWSDAGVADIAPSAVDRLAATSGVAADGALRTAFAGIDRWVVSTYALVADSAIICR